MTNKNYIVNRDNVYVGEVVEITNNVCYRGSYVDYFNVKKGKLAIYSWRSYRSMLFTVDDNKMANDLLYKTPVYPILNITDDDICLNLKIGSVVLNEAYNLSSILQYFNFNDELKIEDLVKIRKMFFTGRFGMDNSRLFGMEEFIPDDFKADIIDSEERYKLYKESLKLSSTRQFGYVGKNELPRELMSVLDERGRSKDKIVFADPFRPSFKEGYVKKLTKF